MSRFAWTVATTVALVVTHLAAPSAAVTFLSTFKSIDAGGVNLTGSKVAALVITNDDGLRVSGEEALVRELSARGMTAVASYRIAPKEELSRAEKAKPWFERAKVEGIVIVRPVSSDSRPAYAAETWVGSSYSTLWGYYGYGWGTVYVLGPVKRETTVVVETTIYSVPRNQLLWAAVTESRSSRDLQGFVEELAKASVEKMQEQGLARAQRR